MPADLSIVRARHACECDYSGRLILPGAMCYVTPEGEVYDSLQSALHARRRSLVS